MDLLIVADMDFEGQREEIIYYLKNKHNVRVVNSDCDFNSLTFSKHEIMIWLTTNPSVHSNRVWNQISSSNENWLVLTDNKDFPFKDLIDIGVNFIVLPPYPSAYLNSKNYYLLNMVIDILAWCIEKLKIKERSLEVLSKKENEVINLLLQGYDDREIGNKLFISDKTVRNHISNILQKVGIKTRTQLVLWALQQIGKIEQLS